MSDKLNSLFDQLRATPPSLPFAGPDQVRGRGRTRARRKTFAVASSAAVTVAAIAVAVATGWAPLRGHEATPADPTATATATISIDPSTDIPAAFMLIQDDLGPGQWEEFVGEIFEGSAPWLWANLCEAYDASRLPSLVHQRKIRTVAYRDGDKETVVEIVERYDAGWGPGNFRDIHDVLAPCGHATPPPGVAPTRYEIIATGFAGDEALLVRHDAYYFDGETIAPQPATVHIAAVRVGNVVATVWSSTGSSERVKAIAVTAAARLR